MILDDFRSMRSGKVLGLVSTDEAHFLKPIDKRNANKQRALLLLHGFTGSPAVFRNLLPSLPNYDAIVAPLLPGHGTSIVDFAKSTADDWLNAALVLGRKLVNEYAEVDVLGLSLGGLISCHLAKELPLHHLYLLAPALNVHGSIEKSLWLAHCLSTLKFSRIRNFAGNLHTQQNADFTYRQLPITSVTEVLTFIQNFQAKLPLCPVDLFLGSHDAVVDSKAVAARFANMPNTTVHWLANSAHILPLDGDMDTILKVLHQRNTNTSHVHNETPSHDR